MRSSLLARVSVLTVLSLAVVAGCDDDDLVPPGDGGADAAAGGGKGGSAVDAPVVMDVGAGGAGGSVADVGGAGGTGDAAVPVDAPAGVQLKVAWWGSPDRHLRTQQVIAMFEATHPGIKVAVEHYDNTQGKGIVGTDYWPTLNAHAADHTLPDVMQQDYAYIEEWTKRGLLRSLDDMIANGTVNLADVLPALVDSGRVTGQVMGISLGTNTQSIVLDTNAFADAKIPIPADDWTWTDFERIALEIKAKLGIFGFGPALHGYTAGWKAVYLSEGQWVFSADGKSLGYSDDLPWIQHWQMILRLKAAGALPRLDQEPGTSNIEAVPLAVGKSAMEFAHSNQLVALWTAAGSARTLKTLPVPRMPGGKSPVYLKPSQYFSVTSNTTHPREAAQLIDFFTNNIDANMILAGERGVPISSKVLGALKPKLSKQAAESFNLIERAGAYATKLPPNDPPEWTTILTKIFTPEVENAVMNGTRTPEEAVALFRVQASDVLAGRGLPDGGTPGDGGAGDGGGDAGVSDGGDAGPD
jgi:multiple sugar transport system substrate-binding protein